MRHEIFTLVKKGIRTPARPRPLLHPPMMTGQFYF